MSQRCHCSIAGGYRAAPTTSDLGDNENLYKLVDGDPSHVAEWSDGQIDTCTSDRSSFRFDLSEKETCTGGNCRVEFVLLYPNSVDFTSVSYVSISLLDIWKPSNRLLIIRECKM